MKVWLSKVAVAVTKAQTRFMTEADLTQMLRELSLAPGAPVSAVEVKFKLDENAGPRTVGMTGRSEHAAEISWGLGEVGRSATLRFWTHPNSSLSGQETAEIQKAIRELVSAFWHEQLRSEKSGLVFMNSTEAKQLADSFVRHVTQENRYAIVLFLDLDHFKQVNDKYNHEKGDEVIRSFGSVLWQAAASNAIVLHRSGDEFTVLLDADTPEDSIRCARNLMHATRSHDFDTGEVDVDVTVGIAWPTQSGAIPTYQELETQAEQAQKDEDKNKLRGLARVAVAGDESSAADDTADQRLMAACLLHSHASNPEPYCNIWLNVLSNLFATAVLSNQSAQEVLDGFVNWASPTWSTQLSSNPIQSNPNRDTKPIFSRVDVLLAAAHGICFASLQSKNQFADGNLQIADTGEDSIALFCSGQRICAVECAYPYAGPIELGTVPTVVGHPDSDLNTRNVVLVTIGDCPPFLPRGLFSKIVYVDPRPSKGGGLPDFWESALASVLTHVASSRLFSRVLVAGELEYGARTILYMNQVAGGINNDTVDYLAGKTGLTSQIIRHAAERLSGRVNISNTLEECLPTLEKAYLKADIAHIGALEFRALAQDRRFLERSLNSSNLILQTRDGCRVNTIAEAYPTVLEILRRQESGGLIDQADRETIELLDFKVELIRPSENPVPEFYGEERGSLDEYFDGTFLQPNGLFQQHLQPQIDPVLDHLAGCISAIEPKVTRRAVLIVPHQVMENQDLNPLGLVSVRMNPRYSDGHCSLNVGFVWRTVEALVGFPYSLYGSVRFAENLFRLLKKKLPTDFASRTSLGPLSYFAQSLHLFPDEYSMAIAKRIVDDASL